MSKRYLIAAGLLATACAAQAGVQSVNDISASSADVQFGSSEGRSAAQSFEQASKALDTQGKATFVRGSKNGKEIANYLYAATLGPSVTTQTDAQGRVTAFRNLEKSTTSGGGSNTSSGGGGSSSGGGGGSSGPGASGGGNSDNSSAGDHGNGEQASGNSQGPANANNGRTNESTQSNDAAGAPVTPGSSKEVIVQSTKQLDAGRPAPLPRGEVPEPSTIALMLAGMAGALSLSRRRRS